MTLLLTTWNGATARILLPSAINHDFLCSVQRQKSAIGFSFHYRIFACRRRKSAKKIDQTGDCQNGVVAGSGCAAPARVRGCFFGV
jgi:hypothetical protein